jgi:hypothetical protein
VLSTATNVASTSSVRLIRIITLVWNRDRVMMPTELMKKNKPTMGASDAPVVMYPR